MYTGSRSTPGQRISEISFAASGSRAKAANNTFFGFGTKRCASSRARATCRLSSGANSGPKETTTRSGSANGESVGSAASSPASVSTGSASAATVSPSAWSQEWPGNGSSRPNRRRWPFVPRTPVRSSSSSHCPRRPVAPLRATERSASPGSEGAS